MCKALLPLKVLVDADAWQIFEKNETYILYFLPLPPDINERYETLQKAISYLIQKSVKKIKQQLAKFRYIFKKYFVFPEGHYARFTMS